LRPLFSKLRARFANYGLLGAADTNGRIFCTSEPTSYSSVADQPFFERAMAQPGLAVTQAAADPDPINEQVLASLGQLQREGRPDIVPAAYRTVSTIANLGAVVLSTHCKELEALSKSGAVTDAARWSK
jgi:hypothetical protein